MAGAQLTIRRTKHRSNSEPDDRRDEDEEPPAPPDEVAADETLPDEGGESHAGAREFIRLAIRLGALIAAVLLALRGGYVLHRAATDPVLKAAGGYGWRGILVFSWRALIFLGVESWFSRDWWGIRFPRAAGWMRAQFEINPQWNAALMVPLVVLVVMLSSGGGALYSAIILVLIGVIGLMFLLGRTPPARSPQQTFE